MPECAAHTNVQRALHALILDDYMSAAGYLRRALSHIEKEGKKGGGSKFSREPSHF
jgi:hypothetical protein